MQRLARIRWLQQLGHVRKAAVNADRVRYIHIKTQRVRQAWTTRGPVAATTEAAALRRAMANADWDTVELHGGLDAAVKKVLESVSAIAWRRMTASCSASAMPRPRQDVSTRAARSSTCYSQATAITSTRRPNWWSLARSCRLVWSQEWSGHRVDMQDRCRRRWPDPVRRQPASWYKSKPEME